jgi:hypothetical protein
MMRTPQRFSGIRKVKLLWALVLLQACAVPVPPTGGPPDTTPPMLVASEPVSGSVNVSTDRLVFVFSEPIDRSSFQSAFSITPELEGPIDIRGSSRRLEVWLPEKLRAETTYRITLDISLRDQRRVSLAAPITLAFSTGSELDRARLSGRMVYAADGAAASGVDVLAFARADSASITAGPLYRTQTGADGRFVIDYLANRSFFVVGLRDANGNRRIDEGEWVAVPPKEEIQADTTDYEIPTPWILHRPDRISPTVERIRAVAESDIEIRLSEPLALFLDESVPDGHVLTLTDSTGTRRQDLAEVWFKEDRPRTLYVLADGLTPGRWSLSGSLALSDSSGNPVQDFRLEFDVPEGLPTPEPVDFLRWTPDSLAVHAEGEGAVRTVWPMEQPGLRLTRPAVGVDISFADTSGTELPWSSVRKDATGYTWMAASEDPYAVMVRLPGQDSTYSLQLKTASMRQLGALGINLKQGAQPSPTIKAHLYPVDGLGQRLAETVVEEDLILFRELPGGLRGRIVVFDDRDGDDTWSPGSLIPYVPAEAVQWYAFGERVRPRWDTIASDSLSFVATGLFVPNRSENPGE